jgi:hypothetical protein
MEEYTCSLLEKNGKNGNWKVKRPPDTDKDKIKEIGSSKYTYDYRNGSGKRTRAKVKLLISKRRFLEWPTKTIVILSRP